MKSLRYQRFYYFFFIPTLIVATVAWTQSLFVVSMLSAFALNRRVVAAVKSNRHWLGFALWLCCFSALFGVCFLADLLLFAHSGRAAFRGRDAFFTSLITMIGGFITEYWLR